MVVETWSCEEGVVVSGKSWERRGSGWDKTRQENDVPKNDHEYSQLYSSLLKSIYVYTTNMKYNKVPKKQAANDKGFRKKLNYIFK